MHRCDGVREVFNVYPAVVVRDHEFVTVAVAAQFVNQAFLVASEEPHPFEPRLGAEQD